jgi:hypothetical protein
VLVDVVVKPWAVVVVVIAWPVLFAGVAGWWWALRLRARLKRLESVTRSPPDA